jgi:hypothetical protein
MPLISEEIMLPEEKPMTRIPGKNVCPVGMSEASLRERLRDMQPTAERIEVSDIRFHIDEVQEAVSDPLLLDIPIPRVTGGPFRTSGEFAAHVLSPATIQ